MIAGILDSTTLLMTAACCVAMFLGYYWGLRAGHRHGMADAVRDPYLLSERDRLVLLAGFRRLVQNYFILDCIDDAESEGNTSESFEEAARLIKIARREFHVDDEKPSGR